VSLVAVAIERVPAVDPGAPAAERVRLQRLAARAALERAGEALGAGARTLAFDARGAPRLDDGWCCSLSHARRLAAAAVGRAPVGIDVEPLREPRRDLVERVLDPAERALLAHLPLELAFARAWTAKEAVLKRAGVGLLELSACRLERLDPDGRLHLRHRGATLAVVQRLAEGHVLALCSGAPEVDEAALARALGSLAEVPA
jgi:phosphopantetheinyl transferase